jgi:copper(I)-binding protein
MKQNMFKTLVLTGVVAISGAVFPASAAENLHVNVPFSFMVGSAKMAPGNYTISQSDNGMITVVGSKSSAMVLSVPSDYTKGDKTALNFTSENNTPVLTQIQVSGSVSREIPLRSNERKALLASAR